MEHRREGVVFHNEIQQQKSLHCPGSHRETASNRLSDTISRVNPSDARRHVVMRYAAHTQLVLKKVSLSWSELDLKTEAHFDFSTHDLDRSGIRLAPYG
jgi:hypothetical protein